MSHTKQRSLRGHAAAIIAAVVSVLLALLLVVNRQQVVDQLTVWQFQPSSEIQALADKSGMGDRGEFYFYASQPTLETAEVFNQKCDREEESTAVLGCYTGGRIYIYNVEDKTLDGIREVTAAHEMLHAAYDRLSEGERQRINALVEEEYAKLRTDSAFAERMAFYDRTEPGQRDNELHSIIGTEVADIDPKLEVHYKAYFTDRNKVVSLHEKYASVFKELQRRSEDLSNQLTKLTDQIEKSVSQYNTDVQQLNGDIESFNTRANTGAFSSEAEFQSERAALSVRADRLEAMRTEVNAKIEEYNRLRDELISVAGQSDALNRSIDSTLAPAPNV
ncbi:hypothetical protein PV379_00770 [Streptomyces caniscabiei]|uniref:hypothetical protein n=1 Tax=Streptomyces caniscabiei TaxID=2746961 RepID=UPI0029A57637|nr:hypothetical protein [Streptomyces caniscabiei]MDX2775889.1 hypothetical protein [Streptomyces caniscabiei]